MLPQSSTVHRTSSWADKEELHCVTSFCLSDGYYALFICIHWLTMISLLPRFFRLFIMVWSWYRSTITTKAFSNLTSLCDCFKDTVVIRACTQTRKTMENIEAFVLWAEAVKSKTAKPKTTVWETNSINLNKTFPCASMHLGGGDDDFHLNAMPIKCHSLLPRGDWNLLCSNSTFAAWLAILFLHGES